VLTEAQIAQYKRDLQRAPVKKAAEKRLAEASVFEKFLRDIRVTVNEAAPVRETDAEYLSNNKAAERLVKLGFDAAYESIKRGQVSQRVFWLYCAKLQRSTGGGQWPPDSGGPGPRGWNG
jgi:hypothetical protein